MPAMRVFKGKTERPQAGSSGAAASAACSTSPYGCDFSSHEAFTSAFKAAYGVVPGEFRKHPAPVVLRAKINPFDRCILGLGEIGMVKSNDDVKACFATISSFPGRITRRCAARSTASRAGRATTATLDFDGTGYRFDAEPGRVLCFYHDSERFWEYVRPVQKG